MRKFFLAAFAVVLGTTASAQYMKNYNEAFKHLGYGIEVSTMGIGVDLSYPLVTDYLELNVGYNFIPKFSVKKDFDFNTGTIDNYIRQVNSAAAQARQAGYANDINYESFNGINVNAKFKPNMGNVKILLKYYPMSYNNFHITAGMMIGSKKLIDLEGKADDATWAKYQTLYNNLPADAARVGVTVSEDDLTLAYQYKDDKYRIDPSQSEGRLKGSVEVNSVKPYLGLGWGRSIPKTAVSFQFEFGVWYHGKPKLVIDESTPRYNGNNIDADVTKDVDDIMDKVEKIPVYPQISFRLTGHLF
jgi:hypothetical protein